MLSISCALALGLGATTAAQAAHAASCALLDRSRADQPRAARSRASHKVDAAQLPRRCGAERAQAPDARTKAREGSRSQPDYGLAGGVSQSTLDAIAACESGGDPTAVDSLGTYYGLYQFDTGTWASVGGSGSPADASPEEQDYRASLLYARAGSSPWPVCG